MPAPDGRALAVLLATKAHGDEIVLARLLGDAEVPDEPLREAYRAVRTAPRDAPDPGSAIGLERFDEVLLLEAGRVAARGAHADLSADGRYRALMGMDLS